MRTFNLIASSLGVILAMFLLMGAHGNLFWFYYSMVILMVYAHHLSYTEKYPDEK